MSDFPETSSTSSEARSASEGQAAEHTSGGQADQSDRSESSGPGLDSGADASNRSERGSLSSSGRDASNQVPDLESRTDGSSVAVLLPDGATDSREPILAEVQESEEEAAASGAGGMSGEGYSAVGTVPPERSDVSDPGEPRSSEPAAPASGDGGESANQSPKETAPEAKSSSAPDDQSSESAKADAAEEARVKENLEKAGNIAEKAGNTAEGVHSLYEAHEMLQAGTDAAAKSYSEGHTAKEIVGAALEGMAEKLEQVEFILMPESVRQEMNKSAGLQDPKDGA